MFSSFAIRSFIHYTDAAYTLCVQTHTKTKRTLTDTITWVSHQHHLCPRSGASSRRYFLSEAVPTASTAHDKLFSSCATNYVFLLEVVRYPCSHFDITPPKSVLW